MNGRLEPISNDTSRISQQMARISLNMADLPARSPQSGEFCPGSVIFDERFEISASFMPILGRNRRHRSESAIHF